MKPFKRRKFTKHERVAFWQHYEGICVHCKRYVRLLDMILDHIIPFDLSNKPDELQGLLERYQLVDLDINSYRNFVPCCQACSLKKANHILPGLVMFDLLRLAKSSEEPVQRLIYKMKNECWTTLILSTARCALRQKNLTELDKDSIHKIMALAKKSQKRITYILERLLCCYRYKYTNEQISRKMMLRYALFYR